MRIARVAIPRPNVETTWDYLIPGDLVAQTNVGFRVLVSIGRSKVTGYVVEISDKPSTNRSLKPILEVIDDDSLLSDHMLELTRWVANYYLASWGDVLKAALPAGLNIREEELLEITPSGRGELANLGEKALITQESGLIRKLLDYLAEAGPQKAASLQKQIPVGLPSKLLEKGFIRRKVIRRGRSLEKTLKMILPVDNPPSVAETFWSRSPKRRNAYELLIKAGKPVPLVQAEEKLGVTSAVLDGLVKAGLAEYVRLPVRRDPFKLVNVQPTLPHSLTDYQSGVYHPMADALEERIFKAFLLHGVTGSGKTEIYMHLAQKCLTSGRTVLILIPELSLTPQFVRRYYSVFGEKLAVLHSALPLGERTDEWNRIRRGEATVVLGTRLSIFAPLENLGLIVVDEEHDQSYKQDDYPVFNARDLALVRASMVDAVCVLGSATPSLESLHNAKKEKFQLLKLEKRVFDRPLPELQVVDLRSKEDENERGLLPTEVKSALSSTLARGEQTLVLVGRKGHSPFVICRACGNNFECPTCSISMAWHEKLKKLKCHYCGKLRELPGICPECGSTSISTLGLGSEKVEDYLKSSFPEARVERMDREVITKPGQYQQILDRLRQRKIDILVGTQMIAKGHDYPGVTTVVAMGLDSLLKLPDFRHSERLFQLITQISGRAGRGEQPGRVFVLTYRPNHYAVSAAASGDWDAFLDKELKFRRSLRYPPFGFLAMILIEDFNKDRGKAVAQNTAEKLHELLQGKAYILGPALAPYARLKNRWRHQVIIKAPDRTALNEALWQVRRDHTGSSSLKINVDPLSLM